ncbi:MAG: GH92 family glycosyl hydrolase [Candidatus Cryptobacteroides sp.]
MYLRFRISALAAALTCLLSACTQQESLTDYVDLRIGSGGHGHVFVGANVPFGMVQLGPTSIPITWDWCSGYNERDSTVIGFSHTHLSGTGIGDLFDVTVMPVVGEVTYARGSKDDCSTGLWSYADRSREVCRPGYYSVPLTRYGVLAEMTATERVGLHRYTFPESEESALVIDLENGGCWDKTTDTYVEAVDGSTLRGWRHSQGWAKDQKCFFYAKLSRPFDSVEYIEKEGFGDTGEPMRLYARLCFSTSRDETILLKVALSSVGMEGAQANMEAELPDWDFEGVVRSADTKWNEALAAIKVETADEKARKIFYTSLFHTMIAPSLFSDCDGSYRGADSLVHSYPGHATYTTFSLWDTYRAAMPLYTIICSERYGEFVSTMVDICEQQGKLPVWHLHACETDCMVGNPGIPAVADAIVKGMGGFDRVRAYDALKVSAMLDERGQDLRKRFGYIPRDLMIESVAYDLEYALADASVALAARSMAASAASDDDAQGYLADAQYFEDRSHSYRNLFDPQLGFIRGKDSRGQFRKEYSPFASLHRQDDYCEGNGWQYTWLVPHDLEGLVGCFGSRESFREKLDSLFLVSSELQKGASADISGLIGQYAHGNEPSHHILYFYTMLGDQHKCSDLVYKVLTTLYDDTPTGLCGNEDVGQMSAWYVLSSLGLYQSEPASGRFWFGCPMFEKASIKVAGGNFAIRCISATGKELPSGPRYISRALLNGKELDRLYITYNEIVSGGELVFECE